jgi:hypothetical protein
MMNAVRHCLKPNGHVVVIECAEENDDDDPVAGHPLGDSTVCWIFSQHGLIFTKTRQPVSGRL